MKDRLTAQLSELHFYVEDGQFLRHESEEVASYKYELYASEDYQIKRVSDTTTLKFVIKIKKPDKNVNEYYTICAYLNLGRFVILEYVLVEYPTGLILKRLNPFKKQYAPTDFHKIANNIYVCTYINSIYSETESYLREWI